MPVQTGKTCPQCGAQVTVYRNPLLTVDIIIEVEERGIVLIERKNPPHGWALPGGFVDYGESLETAARREAEEETGLELERLRQFRAYSDPGRDPRHHTVSVVFTARGKGRAKAADDAAKLEVFPHDRLPQIMAFDHARILADYLESIRSKEP
jgi:ADP-ribose pyrophosphatase YjhB (NUDIX family)